MKKLKKEQSFIFILSILFIILTFFVIYGKTYVIDKRVFDILMEIKCNSLTKFLYVITNLASTVGIVVLLVIIGLIFFSKKCFSYFKYVVLNVGIGVFIMQVIKHIIKRARPSWKWIVQGGFSYPSGHTISAMLLYGTIILIISKKTDFKYKKLVIVLLSLIILLTGISRIYFGAHYLTDVIASIILGFIILIVSNIKIDKEYKNDKNKVRKTI